MKDAEKEHYTNWHWGDWFKDTSRLRSATRGIWLDMIGEMARLNTDRLHAQFDRLPFVLRDTQECIMQAALDLAENNSADVLIDGKPIFEWRSDLAKASRTEIEWMANSMAKSWLTVVCRRRTRELRIKQLRAEAGTKGAESRYGKPYSKPLAKPLANTMASAGNGSGNGNGSGAEDAHTPTLEEFRKYAEGLCIPPDVVESCYHYYAATGFMRGQTRLTGYKSLLQKWNLTERSKAKASGEEPREKINPVNVR